MMEAFKAGIPRSAEIRSPLTAARPRPAARKGRYLYAVMPGARERTFPFTGIDGGKVYAISNGQLAAVVSDLTYGKIRPERRHLAAQQEVFKRLLAESDVLPMSFGIIADSPQAIERILTRNQETLLRQLQRVAGKVEMGLQVWWDVPNIFEYFTNTHVELRFARNRFLGPQRHPTQEDQIKLGRLFERLLNEDREAYTGVVEDILSRHCAEIKRNQCRQEREIMNLACLVGRQAQGPFERGVFAAASLFDNNFAFDYSGPWAPQNFMDIDLKV